MAGKPRTMLDKVDRLEIAAFKLADAILQTMPEQCRNGADSNDEVDTAWNEGLDAAVHVWIMVGNLGDCLREKAGIESDGPACERQLMRRTSRPPRSDLDLDPLGDELQVHLASGKGLGLTLASRHTRFLRHYRVRA